MGLAPCLCKEKGQFFSPTYALRGRLKELQWAALCSRLAIGHAAQHLDSPNLLRYPTSPLLSDHLRLWDAHPLL